MVELKSLVGQIKDVTLGTESLAESGELSSIHVSVCGVGGWVWVHVSVCGVWVHVWVGGWDVGVWMGGCMM